MPDVYVDLHFPLAGIDLTAPFAAQPNRPAAGERWARTTAAAVNVRGYATTDRARGGSRAGLVRFIPTAPVADWIIQELACLVGHGYSPPGGGTVQASNSGRVVTLVAVSQGNIFVLNAGETTWVSPTNSTGDTPPLNFTGVMQSAANNQKLYFADGTNWVYYIPATNTIERWEPTVGALPVDEDGNTPRLICTWRGRTVLSGLLMDPQNWFMSRISDPHDFEYAPTEYGPDAAVAGGLAPQGLIGDVITGLIPYTDDVLIFLCDHSIFMMRGDPAAGGSIDLISNSIGGAWGQAWCMDPYGTIYFFSNRCGIYTLVPGQKPIRISQAIEQLLADIDTGANVIRLQWDDNFQGCHVWITPASEPDTATHFFYEQRSGAWWQDQYANDNHNPVACCVFDGNEASDRVGLMGSWDGFIRAVSPSATKDDGYNIASSVVIGPIVSKDLDDILLKDIQAHLGEDSGIVTYEVFTGRTAEEALASTAKESGRWTSGRNPANLVRRAGHAVYLRLTSTSAWQMETIRAQIAGKGKVRRRSAY